MARDERRRLAVIMFTDMVGFSALAQFDEPLSLNLLQEHNNLLRPIFQAFDGSEVKTIGDAFLVEFDSAVQAVRCAGELQRSLHDRNGHVSPDRRIQVRVGLHLGDVVHSSHDIFGDGVNIAARIQAVAHPGGVCLSQQVLDQVRGKTEYAFHPVPGVALKNIDTPTRVYALNLPWAQRMGVAERLYQGVRFRIGRIRVMVTLMTGVLLVTGALLLLSRSLPSVPSPSPSKPVPDIQAHGAYPPPTEAQLRPSSAACEQYRKSVGPLAAFCTNVAEAMYWRPELPRIAAAGERFVWPDQAVEVLCNEVGKQAYGGARRPFGRTAGNAFRWLPATNLPPTPAGRVLSRTACPLNTDCGIFRLRCERVPAR